MSPAATGRSAPGGMATRSLPSACAGGQAVERQAAGQFDPDTPAEGGAQAGVLGTQAGPFGISQNL